MSQSKGCRTLADFLVVELQTFCRGQIVLKFVGTSVCRTLADFLSRLTAFRLGVELSNQDGAYSAKTETCFVGKYVMLEKTLVHVTIMTIHHWLKYARAPTNCLAPPHKA